MKVKRRKSSPVRDSQPADQVLGDLARSLADHPDDPAVVGRAAGMHYRRGDLKEAERLYRRARDLAPHRAAYHNNLANVLCDLGRIREGIAEYRIAVRLSPSPSAEADTNLKLAEMELRLVVERIEFLERAVALAADSVPERVALGCARILQARPEEALREFRAALELDPNCLPAHRNIGFLNALHPDALQTMKQAIQDASDAVQAFPDEPRLCLHHGELYEAAGMLDAAMARYVRAIQCDARCAEAYVLAGRLAESCGAGAIRKALDSLDGSARRRAALVKKGPDWAAAQLDMAFVRLMRHRALGAPLSSLAPTLKTIRAAIHGGGESAWGFRLWASWLEAAGKRTEAIAQLVEALSRFPRDPWLAHDLGALSLRNGDLEAAVNWFEKASLWAPEEAVPFHSLRYSFEILRHYATEEVRFKRALAKDPHDAAAYFQMGQASLSALKHGEAAAYFLKALGLDPDMAEARCGLARALTRMGRTHEAKAEYRRALHSDPDCADAHRGLASLELAAGNASDEVIAHLDKIRALTP